MISVDQDSIIVKRNSDSQRSIKAFDFLLHRYAENSKRLAKIYRDLPATSLERAVYWVEYVIRHKGAHHLKPASVTLPFYKYILLDVIAFCLAVLVLAVYILKMIVRKVLFIARSSSKSELKKTKSNKKHD